MQEESGEESFYLQDDLGSPMELLDAEGEIREAYAFDEFGVPLVVQSGFIQNFGNEAGIVPVPNALQQQHEQLQPFGFTGYQTDAAGGLYYAQARRYDADTGRFVSEDKVKGFAEAPFTLNPYSYCWNKPMELVDLDGKEAEEYYVYYLNNMDGAKVFGHSSILIEYPDGTSDFYSYMGTGGILSAITGEKSLGYMAYEHLNSEETERFFETGDINVTMHGGGINYDNYDRALRKQITEEEKDSIVQQAQYYIDLFKTHNKGDVEFYVDNTDDPVYQLYSNNCDTVAGKIIGTIDSDFLLCQDGMIDTTPNNSYFVRKMLLDNSWEEITIGENDGWEKMISLPGLYDIGYMWKKLFENRNREGCALE